MWLHFSKIKNCTALVAALACSVKHVLVACCVGWVALANVVFAGVASQTHWQHLSSDLSCISQTWFLLVSRLWRDASCTACPDWKHVDDGGQLLQLHWTVANSTSSFARSTSQYERCFGRTYLGWVGVWWRRPTSEQWTLRKCRWDGFNNRSTSWEVTQSKAMTHTLKVFLHRTRVWPKQMSMAAWRVWGLKLAFSPKHHFV